MRGLDCRSERVLVPEHEGEDAVLDVIPIIEETGEAPVIARLEREPVPRRERDFDACAEHAADIEAPGLVEQVSDAAIALAPVLELQQDSKRWTSEQIGGHMLVQLHLEARKEWNLEVIETERVDQSAIEAGGVDRVVPLDGLAERIMARVREPGRAR